LILHSHGLALRILGMDVASLGADMPRSRNRSHFICDFLSKQER
jgi:hypothetical protein